MSMELFEVKGLNGRNHTSISNMIMNICGDAHFEENDSMESPDLNSCGEQMLNITGQTRGKHYIGK